MILQLNSPLSPILTEFKLQTFRQKDNRSTLIATYLYQ